MHSTIRKRYRWFVGVIALLGVLTAGLVVASAPALASSCTLNPDLPGMNHHPPTSVGTDTTIQCDTAFQVNWYDTLFLGGESYSWNTAATVNPSTGWWPAGAVNVVWATYPCKIAGYHWWGHWTAYRIRWQGDTAWGPVHSTNASAGIYDFCA